MPMRLLKIGSVAIAAVAAVLFAVSLGVDFMSRDATLPQITAVSDTLEIPCDYTQEQLLEGVSASDERDGDLTSQILVGDFSRFIDPGVCDLTYVVFDSADHMATLTRRVTFTDYHSPRFALEQPLCFEAGSTNNTEVRAMFTVEDLLDGDLTDWITYVETDASYSIPGDYTITMEVRNSFGDTVSYDFPIHIVEEDSLTAEIRLTSGLVYVEQGQSFSPTAYMDSVTGASGEDLASSQLSVDSTVDTSTPGLYEVHYELNQAGSYGQTWLTVIVQEAAG